MPKLIITNGDAAVERLVAADLADAILPWRDMLHDGPVPAGPILDEVSDVRAGFLSSALGLPHARVRAEFAARDAELHAHGEYDEVELWFEHDLFDQLQLIQILDYFSRVPERMGLHLVQAEDYLGTLEEDALHALGCRRAPITTVQMETASAAWIAFTAPTPTALAAFAAHDTGPLPHLAPALRRLLAELPAPKSGLSLTEQRILDLLAERTRPVAQLFGAVQAMDEARFLADLPFFLRLDAIAFAREPLIEGLPYPSNSCGPLVFLPGDGSAAERHYRTYASAIIRLTEAGDAARGGTFDHASENGPDRVMGGFRVGPGTMWRYDRSRGTLVAPH